MPLAVPGVAAVLVGGLALVAVVAWRGEAEGAVTNCDVDDSIVAMSPTEEEFLTILNAHRVGMGRPQLAVSPNLSRAAAWMGNDMAAKGYFDHTDSLGRSSSTRIAQCGYPYGSGENMARGGAFSSAQAAFDGFYNACDALSPGGPCTYAHRLNMENAAWRVAGIARVTGPGGLYWVTDFGGFNDSGLPTATSAPASTATPTESPTATPTEVPDYEAEVPGLSRED